jgi:ketosteroid isomerase-like protein
MSGSADDGAGLAGEVRRLRSEVGELRDRQQILDCLNRYARAIDRHDWDLLDTVYHPDAVANHGDFVGRPKDLIAWLTAMYEEKFTCHTHHVVNHLCEIEGDTAHAESNALVMTVLKDGQTINVLGARYLDRFEKRDGKWRIALRRIAGDWRFTARMTELGSFPVGRWDRGDLAYMRPLALTPELEAALAARAKA